MTELTHTTTAPTTLETTVTLETTATLDNTAPSADAGSVESLDIPAVADLRPALEAILMVADGALDEVALATVVGYPVDDVAAALAGLAGEYAEQGRGFELRNVAGGWRFYTRAEYADVVEAFVLDGQQARLTQAALETLAVVAYKQPVSRARVSAIRGVNVDGVMRTLVSRGLVEEAGHDGEHGATLYRTTAYFLERIGITSLDELPELAPYLPDIADLEDDLAESLGAPVASESAGDAGPPASEPPAERDPGPHPGSDPGPQPEREQEPHPDPHPGQHDGAGTEPHGGTEVG